GTKADMPLRPSLTPFRPLRRSSQCPLFFSTLSWQRRSVILIETPTQSVRVFIPFPRSEACRAKGNHMRTLVKPPPSSHCHLCGGELRLKLIESANSDLDLDSEILVCIKCGREQSCTVSHNHNARHMPDPKAA